MRTIFAFLTMSVALFADDRPGRVLFFHASWCSPCQSALHGQNAFPDWLRASKWKVGDSPDCHVQLIDVDQRDDLATIYGVTTLPAMVVVGKKMDPIQYTGRQSIVDLLVPTVKSEAGASPTPYAEVVRVIGLLPKPAVGFVDFGCGADARWCIVAAEKWGCKATGIEIDPTRAALARERVRASGLSHLITIVEGDATTTEVSADVAVAYLYSDVLVKLKPRIEKMTAFASYMHQPPVQAVRNGDTWIYTRPVQAATQSVAFWGGQAYTGTVCRDPRCQMCQSIASQLAAKASPTVTKTSAGGRYETRKFCNGRQCWYENVWVPE